MMNERHVESAPLKRHWEEIRSQETTPVKKQKTQHRTESLAAVMDIDSAVDEWTFETLHKKGVSHPKPIQLIMLNLEHQLFTAIDAARKKINELYVPTKVLEYKGATMEENGTQLEPIMYKVQWMNKDMEPSWVDESFMKHYNDVMDDYWSSYGITFEKNDK